MSLDAIRDAAATYEDAYRRLRELVTAAYEHQAATVEEVADAAGVSRATVHRWINHQRKERGDIRITNRRIALDDALQMLIEVGAGPVDQLLGGLRAKELLPKARRVKLGISNLPGVSHLDEEQRAILHAGTLAAGQVLARSEVDPG